MATPLASPRPSLALHQHFLCPTVTIPHPSPLSVLSPPLELASSSVRKTSSLPASPSQSFDLDHNSIPLSSLVPSPPLSSLYRPLSPALSQPPSPSNCSSPLPTSYLHKSPEPQQQPQSQPLSTSLPPPPPPPRPPSPPPPLAPSSPPLLTPAQRAASITPSRRAVLFVAVVERCPASATASSIPTTCHTYNNKTSTKKNKPNSSISSHSTRRPFVTPSCHCDVTKNGTRDIHPLRVVEFIVPHASGDDPVVKAARDALLKAPGLVFPPDVPRADPPLRFIHRSTRRPHTSVSTSRPSPITQPDSLQGSSKIFNSLNLDTSSDLASLSVLSQSHSHSSSRDYFTTLKSDYATSSTSPSEALLNSPNCRHLEPNVSSTQMKNAYASRLANRIDAARTLPLTSHAAYDALVDEHDALASRTTGVSVAPTMQHQPLSVDGMHSSLLAAFPFSTSLDYPIPRRAKSLPRRSSAGPLQRSNSLGPGPLRLKTAPVHSKGDINIRAEQHDSLLAHRRRSFRSALFSAKTHAFAITSGNGSRQYAFCRPLSSLHALVVLSSAMHAPIYVSAVEEAAVEYGLLVDDTLGFVNGSDYRIPNHRPVSAVGRALRASSTTSCLIDCDVLRCPPLVAKELCSAALSGLGVRFDDKNGGHVSNEKVDHRRSRPRNTDVLAALERDDPSASFSVSLASNGSTGVPASSVQEPIAYTDSLCPEVIESTSFLPYSRREPSNLAPVKREGWTFQLKEKEPGAGITRSSSSSGSLPWEIAAELPDSDAARITRVVELADSTLLFRHFPVRSIVSVLVALLEERRVCVVGPNTSVVSRVVLAFANLIHPFEWPHIMSPILVDQFINVLEAPFPFLVGLLEDDFFQTKALDLGDLVFADMTTGKVSSTSEVGDLYRRVPRRVRNRIDRRLSRAKTACMRQVYRSRSLQSMPTANSSMTGLLGDEGVEVPTISTADKSRSAASRLWWARTSLKSEVESLDSKQNIWLDHDTVIGLDKAMRKFFAELLADLSASRASLSTEAGATGKNATSSNPTTKSDSNAAKDKAEISAGKAQNGGNVGFGSSKRETDRRQLIKAFSQTQMFMQWEEGEQCDFTFGLPQAEPRKLTSLREGYWRRDDVDKDVVNIEENIGVQGIPLRDGDRVQVLSDLDDDILSGDEVVAQPAEEIRRFPRRFRHPRKGKNKGRLQFNSEVEVLADRRDPFSDVESSQWNRREVEHGGLRQRASSSVDMGECVESEAEQNTEPEIRSSTMRRPWYTLRLPSSPWTSSRDAVSTSQAKESALEELGAVGELSGIGNKRTSAEESEPNIENGKVADGLDDVPKSYDGSGRARMLPWGLRKMKMAIRT